MADGSAPSPRTITREEVARHFPLPISKAAESLGVCTTLLKKICRNYGIFRWPQRKVTALRKKLKSYETEFQFARSDERREILLSLVASTQEELHKVLEGPPLPPDAQVAVVKPAKKRPRPVYTKSSIFKSAHSDTSEELASSPRIEFVPNQLITGYDSGPQTKRIRIAPEYQARPSSLPPSIPPNYSHYSSLIAPPYPHPHSNSLSSHSNQFSRHTQQSQQFPVHQQPRSPPHQQQHHQQQHQSYQHFQPHQYSALPYYPPQPQAVSYARRPPSPPHSHPYQQELQLPPSSLIPTQSPSNMPPYSSSSFLFNSTFSADPQSETALDGYPPAQSFVYPGPPEDVEPFLK